MSDTGVPSQVPAQDEELLVADAIIDRLKRCIASVSQSFDQWADPYAHGPGLYFVLEREANPSIGETMGVNRWPTEDCETIFATQTALSAAAQEVAATCDGAVIINEDGTIQAEMKRIKQLSTQQRAQRDSLPYADWMGARHMSALETSTREEVVAALTLSEEDGRMTVFMDGTFKDHPRDALQTL